MLAVFLYLLITLLMATSITIKFKFKQENSILMIFLGTIILIYILGLFNIMIVSFYILALSSLVSLIYIIYLIIKKKLNVNEIITPAVLIYVIGCLGLAIILNKTNYTQWDEFSHWGANLKAMVANDLLWSNNKWDGIHVVYQPFVGLIEYYFCKLNGGFLESISYVAVDVALLTLLLPIFKNVKYKVKDIIGMIIYLFCIYAIIFIFNFSLTSIYIDLLLGITFSIGLYTARSLKDKDEKIILLLIMIALTLIKTTGILFNGIILIILFLQFVFKQIVVNKKMKKEQWINFLKIIGILLLILIVYGTWLIYCKANDRVLDQKHDNNFISEINIKEFIKAVFQYNCNDEKLMSISKSFYCALNEREIISGFYFSSAIKLLVLINLLFIMYYLKFAKDNESKQKVIIDCVAFNIGFVLYCLLILGTFMFAFTDREGRGLSSYERYMDTFFIAWVINIFNMIFYEERKNFRINIKLIIIMMLICLYGSNIYNLIHPISKNNSSIPQYIIDKSEIVKQNLNVDNKVYVIFQNFGYLPDPYMFRYLISPMVMNLMDEYSLGEAKSNDNTTTFIISEKEWEKKLIDENYDYVFILKSDNVFVNTYKDAFEDGTDFSNIEDKIFKVEKLSDTDVKLVLYKGE